MLPGVPGHLSGPLQNAVLCHSTARGCKLAIDLESELSVAVALYSLVLYLTERPTVYPVLKYIWFKLRSEPLYIRGFVDSGFDPGLRKAAALL